MAGRPRELKELVRITITLDKYQLVWLKKIGKPSRVIQSLIKERIENE